MKMMMRVILFSCALVNFVSTAPIEPKKDECKNVCEIKGYPKCHVVKNDANLPYEERCYEKGTWVATKASSKEGRRKLRFAFKNVLNYFKNVSKTIGVLMFLEDKQRLRIDYFLANGDKTNWDKKYEGIDLRSYNRCFYVSKQYRSIKDCEEFGKQLGKTDVRCHINQYRGPKKGCQELMVENKTKKKTSKSKAE